MLVFVGSICLSDIDKSLIKKVTCEDGKERMYLNISVHEMKEPSKVTGDTHFISDCPKKEERVEGRKYIIGNLKEWQQKAEIITPEKIAASPTISKEDEEDLPF